MAGDQTYFEVKDVGEGKKINVGARGPEAKPRVLRSSPKIGAGFSARSGLGPWFYSASPSQIFLLSS